MGPGMFDGLGTVLIVLTGLAVFGLWKLAEVILYLNQHVHIRWTP